ncbi:MAG: hypothetical protein NVSMB66_6600 [Candidatus Doudnabacteria bacterium]
MHLCPAIRHPGYKQLVVVAADLFKTPDQIVWEAKRALGEDGWFIEKGMEATSFDDFLLTLPNQPQEVPIAFNSLKKYILPYLFEEFIMHPSPSPVRWTGSG